MEILTTGLHSSINLVGLGLGNPLLSPKNQFRFVDMAEVRNFGLKLGCNVVYRLLLSLFISFSSELWLLVPPREGRIEEDRTGAHSR